MFRQLKLSLAGHINVLGGPNVVQVWSIGSSINGVTILKEGVKNSVMIEQ
jgi:hypothetical protein